MESAHHFSSRPDCNSTAQVPSFILRTSLSAIKSHSFPIGEVLTYNDFTKDLHRKIFTSFAKFLGIVSFNDFWFPRRLQELLQALFRFLRSFCFAMVRLYPLSCQVLYHYSVSMIVSRFTTFTRNFVICCYQITKFSALGTTGALIILVLKQMSQFSVLREVGFNTVLARYHLCSRHERNSRVRFGVLGHCHPQDSL